MAQLIGLSVHTLSYWRQTDQEPKTIDVSSPSCRPGSYFPDWLLQQRRKRAERALTSVVATCYLLVSDLAEALHALDSAATVRRVIAV